MLNRESRLDHIESIKLTLKNFATEETNSSIVLKGAWGTGKTFLWEQIVNSEGKRFKNRNYSYVSLFGISTLKDLKRALFENKVFRENANAKPSAETLKESFQDLGVRTTGWLKKGSSLMTDLTAFGFRGVGPAIEALQFFRVTDTLIVLDDFERKSASLHDKEVLGLISLLCESKSCRVLMLLNEQNLSDEYLTYHEKVFDYEVSFQPTAEEAASIAFDDATNSFETLKANCVALEINNLRLLKKINRYASIILNSITHADTKILDRAFQILPLAILAIYGGKKAIIDLDYILHERLKPHPDDSDANPLVQEQLAARIKKDELFAEYGLANIDQFDLSIINLVRNGYVEKTKLDELIKLFEEKIEHEKHTYQLSNAWSQYHKSFLNNEQTVIDTFNHAIKSGLHFFSLNELDSVAGLYYELNRASEIEPVIDDYFLNVIEASDLEDEDDVFNWPSNYYLSQKLKEHFNRDTHLNTLSFSAIIDQAYKHKHGMQSNGVLEKISSFDQMEYLSYFELLDTPDYTKIARMLLKCGQMSTSDEKIQKMYEATFLKTYKSFLDLASRSPLNESRMSKFRSYEKLYRSLAKVHI